MIPPQKPDVDAAVRDKVPGVVRGSPLGTLSREASDPDISNPVPGRSFDVSPPGGSTCLPDASVSVFVPVVNGSHPGSSRGTPVLDASSSLSQASGASSSGKELGQEKEFVPGESLIAGYASALAPGHEPGGHVQEVNK